jgi:hypothetical protein
MARRSKSLTVITGAFGSGRPPPPIELTDRQAQIWREVVETEPVDLFATAATRALLVDYCRARETAETYAALIESFDPTWLKTEDGLTRFRSACYGRAVETRAVITLATKLRLTNQSRYQKDAGSLTTRKAASSGQRPWEA